MTTLSRVRAVWSGIPTGPGVSTFYCLNPSAFLGPLRAFLQNFSGFIPSGVSIQVEGVGDTIEDTTGDLNGSWVFTAPDVVVGASPGAYAAPVGIVVDWLTNTILDAHRVRGRTFMVPLSSNTFQDDGTILEVNRTALAASATTFVEDAGLNFAVWHRPLSAIDAAKRKRPTVAHAGGHGLVTGGIVPDLAAVLRSRRD